MMSGSATISRTDIRGFKDAYGSWKTIWTFLRIGRICFWCVFGDFLSVQNDGALCRLNQLTDTFTKGRLSASGLSYDSEYLTASYLEVDVIDCFT